jgi:hypothetical protein
MSVRHPALYAAVYAGMQRALHQVAHWQRSGPTLVFRTGDVADAGARGADKYRTVYRSSTNDDYRWTGPRPSGARHAKAAVGGLYTSLDLSDALLGELTHYALGTTIDADVRRQLDGRAPVLTASTFQPAMARKRIFEYECPAGVLLADLSLGSSGGRHLIASLEAEPSVRAALRAARYPTARSAYVANADHSFPRAVSQAIWDMLPAFHGLRVTSARSETGTSFGDDTGDNVVFFGPDGALIGDLRPTREFAFVQQGSGPMKTVITSI